MADKSQATPKMSKAGAFLRHPFTLTGASIAGPMAALLFNYKLQKRAAARAKKERREEAEMVRVERKAERDEQAKRIRKILTKHKQIKVTELSSGGNKGIMRRINYLRKHLGVLKRYGGTTIPINGKRMDGFGIKKEIGALMKRYDSRRAQRMALESGDTEQIMEFLNPHIFREIAGAGKRTYQKVKNKVKGKIRGAGRELGRGYGEGLNRTQYNALKKQVADLAEVSGERFQKGASKIKDRKDALKMAGLVLGGSALAGVGATAGVHYGKKTAKKLDDTTKKIV